MFNSVLVPFVLFDVLEGARASTGLCVDVISLRGGMR